MNIQSLQQLLTIIFMLLAVAAIVVFFVTANRTLFYILGVIAVVIRLVQYGIRWVDRNKRRGKKVDFDFENDKN